jgi:hypothetical protein
MTALTVPGPGLVQPSTTTDAPIQTRGEPLLLLRSIAVGATIMTALAIYLTGAMDLCSNSGPIALMAAWFLLPVTAISSIAGAATATRRSAYRYLTAIVAVGFAAMWLFALAWAQVGNAIDQVAC